MVSSTTLPVKRLAIICVVLVGAVGGGMYFSAGDYETEAAAVENAPTAEFEYEYDGEDTVTITHTGGDNLESSAISVWGKQAVDANYTINNGDSNVITRGDTITVTEIKPGDTIDVVWIGAGDGTVLGSYTVS